jgi:anti-anti-sigma factor
MELNRDEEQGVVVIRASGRLDELAAQETEKTLAAVLRESPEKMLVDMSGVEYVSSSGLRVLLMLSKAMKKQGGRLVLCGLSPFVAEVFEISSFNRMFEIRDTAETAMAELIGN